MSVECGVDPIEQHRYEMQKRVLSEVRNPERAVRVVTREEAEADMAANEAVTAKEFEHHKADFARHEIGSAERENRISRLEVRAEHQERAVEHLTQKVDEIHSVVTNGLKDKVSELSKAIEKRPEMNGKKPRRLEILTAVIAAVAVAQSIGLLDQIREAIARWFSG